MTKEEHNTLLNSLRTCVSDADRMSFIQQLEQDYTGVLNERDTATANATTAQAEAIKYAKINNELWLQNSNQTQVGQATAPITNNTETETPPAKRTYEDLESKF